VGQARRGKGKKAEEKVKKAAAAKRPPKRKPAGKSSTGTCSKKSRVDDTSAGPPRRGGKRGSLPRAPRVRGAPHQNIALKFQQPQSARARKETICLSNTA